MKRKLISLLLVLSMIAALPWVRLTYAEGEASYIEGEETSPTPLGEGTEENPYRIYTAEQLYAFAALLGDAPQSSARLMCDVALNEGVTFEADVDTGLIRVNSGDTVGYLGTGVSGYAIADGSVQFDTAASISGAWYTLADGFYSLTDTPLITPEAYTPMASAEIPYCGTFDGSGFAIEGAWCVGATSYAGIFAYLGAGATVKNLTVRNSIFISSASGVGAVAGYMHVKSAEASIISDCKNEGSAVVGRSNVAGILGYQNAEAGLQNYPKVQNCVSFGDVMARESYAGGIMGGSTRGSVISSKYGLTASYGTVYAALDYAAGITPTLVNGNSITNCYNEGDIYASRYAAGIASQSNRGVERCVNEGDVTARDYASGVVGRHVESNTVRYCANLGEIKADRYAAGITVGTHIDKRAPKISYCYNAGDISARVRASGIVCAAYYMEWVSGEETKTLSTTIKFCYSTDSASASEIDSDAICPYFDEKAPDAVDCEIIKKHDVLTGALAYKFADVMRQNLAEDEYPTPTADSNFAVYKGLSADGYVFYSNSKSEIHRTHVNEDGDCYCDECEYTFTEEHVNEDCDCYCDVCGEYDADGHSFTSGGLCKSCGAMRDGATALYAANLTISSGIRLGLIMKLNHAASVNPAAYAEISVGKESVKIMVSDAERSGEYFVFTVPVPAKYFSSDVTVQICGLDIGKGDKHSYSVKKYLEKLDLSDPTLADLTEAVRLWGGAAQEVGKIDTDNLLNDGLSYPSSDEIATGIPTDKKYETTGEIEGMTMSSKPSITLAESFTVRFTFKGIDGVKFYYGGAEITPTALPLERFAVDVSGIPASDIAKDITLIAVRGDERFTVTYSILDEIVKNYKGGNKTEAHLKLFYAVLNYAEQVNLKGGTVKLNMNGGTVENDTVIFDGTSDVRLPTEGINYELGGRKMRFLGWYLEPEFKNAVTFISAKAVGTINVYARWDVDFLDLSYEEDAVLSGEGESFTDGGVTYAYPEASGAKFEVRNGRLIWSAGAAGSSVSAKSSVGAMVENLTQDGYISYAITLSELAMDTGFGISVGGRLFEFFRTTRDGKVFFGEVEILPDEDGKFELLLAVSLNSSRIYLYGSDGGELASHRLTAALDASTNVLIQTSAALIGDGALDIISFSEGTLSLVQADVMRGHLFRKNAIEYKLDGGEFTEWSDVPTEYNTSSEPTKLPSGEHLKKDNHFFAGWYADENFTVPIDEIPIYSLGAVPVYAKWNMIFLDVDYGREDAVDPNIFESKGGKSANGISYSVVGDVGTYKIFTDENGEEYLLVATEKNGTQMTSKGENKLSAITSPDLSVSFVITLGASAYNVIRRPDRNEEGEIVEYTDKIDESNLTSTYLRLRAVSTNADLLYVFKLSESGVVTMGGVEIARLDTESGEPLTLRIVADFKNGSLTNYDENGNALNTVKFELKNASSYEQMLRLLGGECFCMRVNTDNAAFKLYDVKIVESNVLGK